jgi:hypothetical protein
MVVKTMQVEEALTLHDIEISLITLHWFLTLFARNGVSPSYFL